MAETSESRGTSGGAPTAAERGLATGVPASLSPYTVEAPFRPGESGRAAPPADGTNQELVDGFAVLAAWLELAKDARTARELRELAVTLGAKNGTLPFYEGLTLGLQMGVTKACVDALEGYRASFAELRKIVATLASGDFEIIEKVAIGLAEAILTVSDMTPESLERMADTALELAKGGARPETRALIVDFAVVANQTAKIKRMFAVLKEMTLGDLLQALDDFVTTAILGSVRELVGGMLDFRTSPHAVGEVLGTWLGVGIATSLIVLVESIVPFAPPRASVGEGQ